MKVRVTTEQVRKTLRTSLAVLVTVAALVPVLVELGAVDPAGAPWLVTIVAGAAFVTRVMQNPTVDALLGRLLGAPFTIDGLPPAARRDPVAVEDVELPAGPGDASDLA